MRIGYDEQLKLLHAQIAAIGNNVIDAIKNVSVALKERDKKLAETIVQNDGTIDQLEKTIESQCLKLLLMEQPVARDLRNVSSALKMITDFERIGDFASDIAEIVLEQENDEVNLDYGYISEMTNDCVGMVSDCVRAFINQDYSLAEKVCKWDDKVDRSFHAMKLALLSLIQHNPAAGDAALDLMMVAKYLERVGDHATNIAEWTMYAITGVHVKAN